MDDNDLSIGATPARASKASPMSAVRKVQLDATPAAAPSIEVARPTQTVALAGMLQQIAAETGTPYFHLIREFAGLAFGPGRLSFDEYVALRLFDPKMYDGVDKRG